MKKNIFIFILLGFLSFLHESACMNSNNKHKENQELKKTNSFHDNRFRPPIVQRRNSGNTLKKLSKKNSGIKNFVELNHSDRSNVSSNVSSNVTGLCSNLSSLSLEEKQTTKKEAFEEIQMLYPFAESLDEIEGNGFDYYADLNYELLIEAAKDLKAQLILACFALLVININTIEDYFYKNTDPLMLVTSNLKKVHQTLEIVDKIDFNMKDKSKKIYQKKVSLFQFLVRCALEVFGVASLFSIKEISKEEQTCVNKLWNTYLENSSLKECFMPTDVLRIISSASLKRILDLFDTIKNINWCDTRKYTEKRFRKDLHFICEDFNDYYKFLENYGFEAENAQEIYQVFKKPEQIDHLLEEVKSPEDRRTEDDYFDYSGFVIKIKKEEEIQEDGNNKMPVQEKEEIMLQENDKITVNNKAPVQKDNKEKSSWNCIIA